MSRDVSAELKVLKGMLIKVKADCLGANYISFVV